MAILPADAVDGEVVPESWGDSVRAYLTATWGRGTTRGDLLAIANAQRDGVRIAGPAAGLTVPLLGFNRTTTLPAWIEAPAAGAAATIYGAGAPNAAQGQDGSVYIDTITGNRFVKAGNAWGLIIDLLTLYGADHRTWISAVTDPWPPGPSIGSNGDTAIWAHSGALAQRINGVWAQQADGSYTADTRAQVFARLRQILDTNGAGRENGIVPTWDASAHTLRLRGRRAYNAFGTPVGTLTGVEEDQYYDITAGQRSVWIKGASVWHQALREAAAWALPGAATPGTSIAALIDTAIGATWRTGGGGGFDLEQVQDAVAAMIQNGTGITWAYDDATGLLTPTVTATGGGGLDLEEVQDAVAALIHERHGHHVGVPRRHRGADRPTSLATPG